MFKTSNPIIRYRFRFPLIASISDQPTLVGFMLEGVHSAHFPSRGFQPTARMQWLGLIIPTLILILKRHSFRFVILRDESYSNILKIYATAAASVALQAYQPHTGGISYSLERWRAWESVFFALSFVHLIPIDTNS